MRKRAIISRINPSKNCCHSLIGVGLESIGVEEFVEGKFFDGELFIDNKKESYKKLGFKRLGLMGIGGAIFSKKSRDAAAKVVHCHCQQNKDDG